MSWEKGKRRAVHKLENFAKGLGADHTGEGAYLKVGVGKAPFNGDQGVAPEMTHEGKMIS